MFICNEILFTFIGHALAARSERCAAIPFLKNGPKVYLPRGLSTMTTVQQVGICKTVEKCSAKTRQKRVSWEDSDSCHSGEGQVGFSCGVIWFRKLWMQFRVDVLWNYVIILVALYPKSVLLLLLERGWGAVFFCDLNVDRADYVKGRCQFSLGNIWPKLFFLFSATCNLICISNILYIGIVYVYKQLLACMFITDR